jgi:hypothetical protein
VAAWPLKVCVEKGHDELRREQLRLLLTDLMGEGSPVRRGDAFSHIVGAHLDGPREEFRELLLLACQTWTQPLQSGKRNRRGASAIRNWAYYLASFDRPLAEELIDDHVEASRREEVRRQLDKPSP